MIVRMDYLFIPMKADRMVLESTLNFATTLHDRLITTGIARTKGLYLFWNMVDRRERNRLYDLYEESIARLGLQCLSTRIPVRSNFTKDVTLYGGPVYRSTMIASDAAFIRECGFKTLMQEILSIMKLPGYVEKE